MAEKLLKFVHGKALIGLLFLFFITPAFSQTGQEKAEPGTEQEWTRERVDSLVKSIREYFDELLDVELGWAALQARHLSNVGYGIDNRIGLNGELRDTLEFLRNVFESELFVKSMLKYDHFWPNLINRKQYSPKPNELEKQHDGLYAQSLYFDIVFYPSWDTVAMDVDAAREAGKIGYKCTIAVNGLGEFEADLDGDEMSRILNGLITGKEYTKIKQQAGPDVNESMMAGLGWLAEKFDYKPFDDPTNIKRVDFCAPVSQNYGYDAYENAILSGNYDNVSIKGKQYHVPWKSVAISSTESIKAIVKLKEEDRPAGAELKFVTTTGQPTGTVTQVNDTTYEIVLPPVTSEGEFGLLATYSYKNEEDKEITVNAGQANISGYTTNPKKVVIVPVNGNKEGLTATGLKKALDEIYKQAATTWDVEIYTGNLQVKSVYADDGKLDDGKPGLLSNYTEEMSEIIKTFKDRPGVHIDKNTCYLFLVDKAKSGPGKCGFMPLKRPFGFIFTDSRCSNNISHTIAHELGHGPFRLYHTFSSENEYKQGKGTTDNLMDYMTSTEKLGENKALYKYQWDLIHDPERMLFAWAQGEEEGAMTAFFGGITWIGNRLWGLAADEYESKIDDNQELFNHIYEKYDDYFVKSKEANTNLSEEAYKEWSVRSYSHEATMAKTVFEKIGKATDCEFLFTNKGIYFENYTLEEQEYKVAIYSQKEDVTLINEDVKLASVKALRNNKVIKAGFTKKYKLITFYDSKGDVSMVIQIIGGKNNEAETTQWLNYLGLLLPSDEQEKEDTDVSITQMLTAITLYQFYQLTAIWNGLTVEETATTKDDSELYIVCKGDANIRKKESPYALVSPEEFLEKGKEVKLITHLTTGSSARALVRYKDGTEEYCTSTSNLKPIVPIEDEQQYKLREQLTPLTLPFSEDTEKKIETTEILYVTHDCGEYKRINKKDDDEFEFLGWVKADKLKKYIDNSNLGKDEFSQKYLKATETAVEDIVEDWKTEEAACNLCVRAALYNLTGDEVLYPKVGSSTTIRDKGTQLYGKVEAGSGSAQGIIDDLKNGKLDDYFELITKQSGEKHTEFWSRLQGMVDNKEIIIGTYDPGHVFMIVPGGMYEVVDNTNRRESGVYKTDSKPELGDRYGFTFASRKIDYVLRVMDCGAGLKFTDGPFYGAMDAAPLLGVAGRPVVRFYRYKQN